MKRTVVGIIGCGQISAAYCHTLKSVPAIELKACADLNPAAAALRAGEYGIEDLTPERLLADDSIEIVVNLTVPAAHHDVNMQILSAGKHAYSEKPMALSVDNALRQIELAEKKGARIGSAPDTQFGTAHQNARAIVDGGEIGAVTSATATTMFGGPTHPSPRFFYQKGGGPILDMAPYHLTHLISFLGPIGAVRSFATTKWPDITIRVGPNAGETFRAEVPTHYVGILEFVGGAVATMSASFEGWKHTHPHLELYGTLATLTPPNPDYFGGDVTIWKPGEDRKLVSQDRPYSEGNLRGLGVAEMADAIAANRPHRANDSIALHVLEVMLAFDRSSDLGGPVEIQSTCARPEPLRPEERIGGL